MPIRAGQGLASRGIRLRCWPRPGQDVLRRSRCNPERVLPSAPIASRKVVTLFDAKVSVPVGSDEHDPLGVVFGRRQSFCGAEARGCLGRPFRGRREPDAGCGGGRSRRSRRRRSGCRRSGCSRRRWRSAERLRARSMRGGLRSLPFRTAMCGGRMQKRWSHIPVGAWRASRDQCGGYGARLGLGRTVGAAVFRGAEDRPHVDGPVLLHDRRNFHRSERGGAVRSCRRAYRVDRSGGRCHGSQLPPVDD